MKRFTRPLTTILSPTLPVVLALVAVLASAVPGLLADGHDEEIQSLAAVDTNLVAKLTNLYSFAELQSGVYVGSEFCLACHPSKATWRDTKHAQALRRPLAQYSLVPGKGVVADFDGNGVDDFMQGLDFNAISSAFDPFKPNAPVLSYDAGTYAITIGELTLPLVSTQGGTGDWKQRYLVRVPVGDTADGFSVENYVSPVQYNEVTDEYVLYHPEAWYDANDRPRFGPGTTAAQVAAQNNRTYSKKCIGCHTTGIRQLGRTAAGEYFYRPLPAALFRDDDPSYFDYDHDGLFDIVNVGCEACHGPGSPHILGGGDPEMIANPDKLDTAEANAVCGQCHLRVKSVPGGLHDWPYRDDTGESFLPGRGLDLTDFFTDASGRWPDGVNSRQHHQQYLDFLESPKPGFRFHPVKCIECHAAHGDTTNPHLVRDVIVDDGIEIATRNDNDSLCLACHAGFGPFADLSKDMIAEFDFFRPDIAQVVSAHTHHPFAPERRLGLSRCSGCHMPKISKSAINYDIHSHTFEAIAPQKTLMFQDQGGMPNSCGASCHGTKVNLFGLGLNPDIGVWDEAFDRDLARELETYFGPGGLWWDTSQEGSITYRHLLFATEAAHWAIPREAVNDD